MKAYILLILMLIFNLVKGQQKKEYENTTNSIIIEGEIIDSLTAKTLDKKNVGLTISTFPSSTTIAPYVVEDGNFGYKEKFKFSIPATKDQMYIQLVSPIAEMLSVFDNVYTFNSGDSVYVKISNNSFKFSGKGSEKLNCQTELYKLRGRFNPIEVQLLQQKEFAKAIYLENKRLDSLLTLQINVVTKYAPKLDLEMTQIMLATCYGVRYSQNLRMYEILSRFEGTDERIQVFVSSDAYKNIDLGLNQKLNEKILIKSTIYCDFLYQKLALEILIDSKGKLKKLGREQKMVELFAHINKTYTGLLRDKLLTIFCLSNKQVPGVMLYLDESLKTVKSQEYLNELLKLKTQTSFGTAFFQFELEDTNGKIVKLSDLDDKVVVLDFWFTGCSSCAVVYQGMKPIVEKYKNNPRVKFVSISVDQNREDWIKSVNGGKYTDLNILNVYTQGLGRKHPLISNYNISGYPTLFLLKNGKIFSSTPPKVSPQSESDKIEYISLIEQALIDF